MSKMLTMKEVKLDDLKKNELVDKTSVYEELQTMLQNKSDENIEVNLLLDQGREVIC